MFRGKRAQIYIRVSDEEQTKGYSIEGQEFEVRRWCATEGLEVVGVERDEGISGKNVKDRPGLLRAIARGEEGGYDVLVVWSVSRLGRNTKDVLNVVDRLAARDITFCSMKERFEFSSTMGRFMLTMMGSLAELERSQIIDRVTMGAAARGRKGAWSGPRMLGYRWVKGESGEKCSLEVVPEEEQVVRRIFEMAASGHGFKAIANGLNREGHHTVRGMLFSALGVRDILHNPFYHGELHFGRHKRVNGRIRRQAPAFVAPSAHPAIIDDALWGRAQSVLAGRAGRPRRTSDRGFPLAGLLRCPQCGAGMSMSRATRTAKSGEKRTLWYYACGNWKSRGPEACKANTVRADRVEDAVFRRLGDLCTDPKLARQVAQRINARRDDTAPQRRRLAAIAGERAEAGKAKAKYLAAFESDALPADLVGARTREIADRVAALDAEEGRLRAVVDAEPAPEVDPEAVRAVLARFHEVLQRAPHMEKRALLRVLVRRITLNAERDLDSIEVTISDELAAALGADASLPPASEGGVTVAV